MKSLMTSALLFAGTLFPNAAFADPYSILKDCMQASSVWLDVGWGAMERQWQGLDEVEARMMISERASDGFTEMNIMQVVGSRDVRAAVVGNYNEFGDHYNAVLECAAGGDDCEIDNAQAYIGALYSTMTRACAQQYHEAS